MNTENNKIANDNKGKSKDMIDCGLIMPIAPMNGYHSEQFRDVKSILIETISEIKDFNFNVRMVSDSKGEIEIIHKNIVNNIYEDPIVICDVSGSNPNVLFELGMRLAFDKPTIIIKDDVTDYMFDTSMIEHIEYPSDLRYNTLLKFKETLKMKILKTYETSLSNENYSPFLKHFQNITVKSIDSSSVEVSEALNTMLEDIQQIKNNQYNYETKLSKKQRVNVMQDKKRDILKAKFLNWIESDFDNRITVNFYDAYEKDLFSKHLFFVMSSSPFTLDEISEIFNEAQDTLLPF